MASVYVIFDLLVAQAQLSEAADGHLLRKQHPSILHLADSQEHLDNLRCEEEFIFPVIDNEPPQA
jgi:hypothetical protein